MRPRLHDPLLILIPCAVLFLLTRLNYTVWPLVWPDEALFSSPAASLVRDGVFATPVLEGLIPGMDRATLWNSPLFMVLLAGVYTFTGESLHAARFLSFLLGCGALGVFFRLVRVFVPHRFLAVLTTTLLAFDPTFQRAANTARMDMLTVFFFLSATFMLVRARLLYDQGPAAGVQRRSRQRFAYAGLCVGLAAASHPAAIVLAPIALLFALPGWRNLLWVGAGTTLPIGAWLVYIVPNFDLFRIQFLPQLARKPELMQSWSETGGPFVVFASQFGGTKIMMGLAACVFALVFAIGALRLWRRPAGQVQALYPRIYLSFVAVFGMVLFMSEAWYPVYVTPLLLLTAAIPATEIGSGSLRRAGLGLAALFFFIATVALIGRHHFVLGTPAAARAFQTRAVQVASGCRSVYVRVRPDPYFVLRTVYPDMEVLEFVPGKLQFDAEGGREAYLRKRYDTIHCFLVDPNKSWEPILSRYLDARLGRFTRETIGRLGPLEPAVLWRRR